VSLRQRYTRLEAQSVREASQARVLLEYRSRLQGPVSLRLQQQATQPAEPVRPASELEVEAWMQSLRLRQPVSALPARQVSPLVAVGVRQTL
jgi:hypothetical protein